MIKSSLLGSLMLWLFLLTACSTSPEKETSPPQPLPLTGIAWQLTDFFSPEGTPVAATQGAHLKLTDNNLSVSGFGGCNRFVGAYQTAPIASHPLRFSRLASTRMLCANPETMKEEALFMETLAQTTQYEITDKTLTLYYGYKPLLRFSPPAPATAKTVQYLCEQQVLAVTFENEQARFDWQNQPQVLTHAPSGSGAKYQNAEFTFWTKGPRAFLILPDRSIECRQTP